jgi:coniferyl-aldehyde dehydrogenase
MEADALQGALNRQRRAFLTDGPPNAAARIERLDRLVRMVLAHADEIVDALSRDFGTRSAHSTRSGDVLGAVAAIRYNRDNLRAWMEPDAVPLPPAMELAGARAEVRHQPLGVVGAIVPWNGPVLMGVLAAAGALAAGNRLMLKVPELTPRASALLERMFAASFAPEEVCVVQGDAAVGSAFSRLRFDHLLFTGSAATARHVARAAADNLVPVTLELGGRNPVIVGRDADLELTAARLTAGKMASAGQVCVSPDYVLAPRSTVPSLVNAIAAEAARLYPRLLDNDDCTAIASPAHFQRLRHLLDDARRRGAHVVEVNPAGESLWDSAQRKFPLCILTDVTTDMLVLQEETFGPILSVLAYDTLEDALALIAAQPHPLSAYYFGHDPAEEREVVERVVAGNMVVNDVRCQLFFEQLPFGGVGPSGSGRYRGHAGFRTFSNAKAVVYQMQADAPLAAQRPPFTDATRDAVKAQLEALRAEFPAPQTHTGDKP